MESGVHTCKSFSSFAKASLSRLLHSTPRSRSVLVGPWSTLDEVKHRLGLLGLLSVDFFSLALRPWCRYGLEMDGDSHANMALSC